MISDARGGHVSPGIYTEEKDVTYSVKSLGITSLGLVGETLYGPAFENIEVQDWSEYVDYFGGTSPEKFKGTGLPKYELPYIAKSYLEQSKRLNVVRVLGLSGYDAGPAFVIKTTNGDPAIILRSKMSYSANTGSVCEPTSDKPKAVVESVTVGPYTPAVYDSHCATVTGDTATTISGQGATNKFSIIVKVSDDAKPNYADATYNVSLDANDSDYIYRVLSSSPDTGTTPIYIEAVYENAVPSGVTIASGATDKKTGDKFESFKEEYRPALTPWLVSEAYASTDGEKTTVTMKKLFRFLTISDGDAANYQVKVSIQNISPENGTFDVIVRDFNDTDNAPVYLERFINCSMVEGTPSYIAFKIGSADGGYVSKSKYITVEMAEDGEISNAVPCGFLGYPMPKYVEGKMVKADYNTTFYPSVKAKRQYFGGLGDIDIVKYKGKYAYVNDSGMSIESACDNITNGFHMDSILSHATSATTFVDGVSGYVFTSVDTEKVTPDAYEPRLFNAPVYLKQTIYKDMNVRKFTVLFYGGFDGWDVNRDSRTNTDDYKATKYPVSGSSVFETVEDNGLTLPLDLPSTAITSDYYAYLAGYRVFANPQSVDINILATPGIDWLNNRLLTEDVIDIIEDTDNRGGDALYISNAPYAEKGNVLTPEEIAEKFYESEINSSYFCTYFPWIMYYDATNRRYLDLPVTKDVVRNMAETDNNSYPWFAPAGTQRGNVKCVKATYKTNMDDEDILYENMVNPVKTFAKDGVKIWGNKTGYRVDSPLNRINVRRLMIRVKKLVTEAAKDLIFEQYDDTLEQQFRGIVEPILAEVKSNRGIYDYKIVIENTPETRDQHILPCKILIKPTPTLEYISISFVVYPQSIEFQD